MDSIIQKNKECYICGNTHGLHLHHIFPGYGYRKNSDDEGLTVYLCVQHHMYVHQDSKAMLQLQQVAQKEFEKKNSRKKFIELFGKSFL